MPSIWELLTARGRFILVVGIVAAATTIYLGQRPMIFMGIGLALLPLIPVFLLRRSRTSIRVERTALPPEAPVGMPIDIELTIDKDHDLNGGVMLFRDNVPPELGRTPRFTVHQFEGQKHRVVGYRLHTNRRGRYALGPVEVETRDPFGMVRLLRRQREGTTQVKVTPMIHPLDPGILGSITGMTGDSSPQRISSMGEDDVLVREYRHGDDMRRVHWRSTARTGELMVRREERSGGPSAVILLDSRITGHAGQGPESSFEWAVSAAASLAVALTECGYRVSLIDAMGTSVEARPSGLESDAARLELIDALTDVQIATETTFTNAADALAAHHSNHMVIAILGKADARALDQIVGIRRGRTRAVAFVLDSDTFTEQHPAGGSSTHDQECYLLTECGWRVVPVSYGTSVPAAWQMVRGLS